MNQNTLTRRQLMKRLGLGAGALATTPALGAFLEACGSTASTGGGGTAAKPGGTLRFGLSSYPPSFNPFLSTGSAAYNVSWTVHRGLVGYDGKGNFRPEIAQSWQVQDGGRTVVFNLRKNAVFHNGDPVTADDVKFSFDYMRNPANAAYMYSALTVVQSVDVVDANTVRFTLPTPDAALLAILAQPVAPIVSRKELTANPTNFVGAGPYVFKAQEQGVKVQVAKFPKYYKAGLPKLDGIDFIAYADDNLRVTALQSGDVDMIDYVPWQNIGALQSNAKLTLAGTDTAALMYLVFNLTKPPFDNPAVRDALGYAINRENIVSTAFFGSGTVAPGAPIPPNSAYYDKAVGQHWSYDPKKAKSMLARAGYPNGFSASLLSTAQYGMHKDTAVGVQQDLAKVGVKVALELPDWATRVARGNSGSYEFAVMGAGGPYNDPDYLTAFLTGSTNQLRSVGATDPKLPTLLSTARGTTDVAARKSAYAQVQKVFTETAPLLPLTWRSQYYGLAKTVHDFQPLPGFLVFYSTFSLEQVTLSR